MPKKKFFTEMSTESPSAGTDDFAAVFENRYPEAAQRPVYSEIIPIEQVRPSPFQARKSFDGLDELRDAIIAHGFQSRLRVRPAPDTSGIFQLVYGERRLRAAQAAGLTEIPVDIGEYSDAEMIEIGLSENIQRQDLRPLEEAEMFARLIESSQYTIRSLAERVGKNKDYVDTRLALLRAPDDVRELVERMPDAVTAARRIASVLDPQDRKQLIDGLLNGSLKADTVRIAVNTLRDTTVSRETPVRLNGQTIAQETQGESKSGVRLNGQESHVDPVLTKIASEEERMLTILRRWQKQMHGADSVVRQRISAALERITENIDRPQP